MIHLHRDTWIPGYQNAAYYGPIRAEWCECDPEHGFEKVLALLEDRAELLGATHVVGVEVEADPFEPLGVRWVAHGTAARLEPIRPWGGS